MASSVNCMNQKKYLFFGCLLLCAAGALIALGSMDGTIRNAVKGHISNHVRHSAFNHTLMQLARNLTNTILNRPTASLDVDFSTAPELTFDQMLVEEKKYRAEDNRKYMTCPTSWRKKIQNDPVFSQRYIPDVPILMWNEHFNASEYRRLSQFGSAFGWRGVDYMDVRGALEQLNTTGSRYMFDDRMVNGQVPEGKCITCAVIGNGGILNGSRKGEEIDAHDYVFRVNTALTQGFETDVGARTSFYCFTMITLSNTLALRGRTGFSIPKGDEHLRYLFFADSEWTYSYLSAALAGKPLPKAKGKYKRSPMTFPRKLTADNIKVVHPDFERYIKWNWVNSSAQHKGIYRPTTGGIMILTALHACDQVSLYGFSGSYTAFSEYYYDKTFRKHVSYANHDYNKENKLWELMDEHGIVSLYRRKA